jgi:hypothetical protein
MDFGGTKKVDGIIDAASQPPILKSRRYKTKNMATNAELLDATRQSLREFGATPQNCVIGISAAGAIDAAGLRILHSPNTKIPPPLDFAAQLQKEGYRVALGNDLAMAAFGVGKLSGHGNAVVITFSSGLNAGVLVNGQPLETETGHTEYPYAAEWTWKTPPACNCPGAAGKKCVEAFASGNAAGRMFRAAFLDEQVKPEHPVFFHLLKKMNDEQMDGAPFTTADLLDPKRRDKILDQLASESVYAGYTKSPCDVTTRIRNIQQRAIAYVLKDALLHYGRQRITLIGGMTHWWSLLFAPAIEQARRDGSTILRFGEVEKCPYDDPCLVGAALYAQDKFNVAR